MSKSDVFLSVTHLSAVYKKFSLDEAKIQIGWKMKGYKIKHYEIVKQKKAWVVMVLTSDEINFKSKVGTRDKERCHIFMKASIHSENITIM